MTGKIKVLMIGPGRNVMGGISTVINNYYTSGLDKVVDLCYISTMRDGSKISKLVLAIKAYIKFSNLLNRYDIVHIHMAAQSSFDRKAVFIKRAYKAGKKIIIHQHAADFDKYFFEQINEGKRKKVKYVFDLADRIIVLSEEWAEFFGKHVCDSSKIEVVYNGVIIPECEQKDYGDHNVLMLGQLGKRKGTYDLLKAIPIVLETIPDATFFLGGNGDIKQCRKIVLDDGLEEKVVFIGWVHGIDKEEYFKKCSTFILPSYHEGMPMAVLEAMSYGLATISTNAGGIPEIIEQNVSGVRIEAGDIGAIAKALIDILKNRDKREQMGKAGQKRIYARFDFKLNITKLRQIYSEVIKT